MVEAVGLDKKNAGSDIHLIVLEELGRPFPAPWPGRRCWSCPHVGKELMDVTIVPSTEGAVTPPPSKSQAHRAHPGRRPGPGAGASPVQCGLFPRISRPPWVHGRPGSPIGAGRDLGNPRPGAPSPGRARPHSGLRGVGLHPALSHPGGPGWWGGGPLHRPGPADGAAPHPYEDLFQEKGITWNQEGGCSPWTAAGVDALALDPGSTSCPATCPASSSPACSTPCPCCWGTAARASPPAWSPGAMWI